MSDQYLGELIQRLAHSLMQAGQCLVTAESCTGGWIAKLATDQAGSSAWFERGFVTYSNAAKCEMLGVAGALIENCGAVSREVAEAMAAGALAHSAAHWSVAITGIAGPDGGSADKPVGTVWVAWAGSNTPAQGGHFQFSGDRETVRRAAVEVALKGLLQRL